MRGTYSIEPDSFTIKKRNQKTKRQTLKTNLVVILLLIGVVCLSFSFDMLLSPRIGWFLAGGTMLVLIMLVKHILGIGWISAPIAYMIIFWAFHFGLIFPASVVPRIINLFPRWGRDWLFFSQTSRAILMSMLFLLTFAIGLLMIYRRPSKNNYTKENKDAPELAFAGWVIIGVGLIFATISLVNYGISIFFENYQTFYRIHNAFSWPLIIIATGLMLQAAGGRPPRSILITSIWIFVPLAMLVATAGSRTAAIFSAVALTSVLYERGLRLSKMMLFIGVLLLLVLTSTIKQARHLGLSTIIEEQHSLAIGDPIVGLTELGGSLRPVTATINYAEDRQFFYGETFAFPFIRQLERFTGTRKSVLTDDRFIAEWITRLYGAIGYSVVAEGYINGGAIGVALVALFWSVFLGLLARFAHSPYGLALLAAILIPCLINIRNSFLFVPAWFVLGIIPIFLAALVAKRNSRKKNSIDSSLI